ncbi:MAG: glycosyltransferase family 39 protein [Candidatus Daviesbacteria bacterium]|nr:glycosyltransferase family 39 protein [Candidatus Daviesbacteria bacterium]
MQIKNFLSRFRFLLLALVLTIPLYYSLIRPGFFPMQDDLQAFRLYEMHECFKDLQIPCRWIPDAGYGYGYPLFNFYSPGVYYLGEIFHLIGFQFIDVVKILFILGFLAGTFSMFFLIKELFGAWAGMVGALLFSYSPFKATEVYVRGSLSEFWAQVFFPFIFWSSYKLIKTSQIKYLILLALSWGLLLITHNLMSFIFAPLFLVWVIYWMLAEKKWISLPKVIGGILLGFGLASFFILPLIFERGFVHLETLLGGYFDYRQHFVSLYQLFISNHFGYGSSFLGPIDDLSLSVGIAHWIVGLMAVILAILNFKKYPKVAGIILTLATVEVMVIFLMHQRSSFIWENFSAIWWLQFPWRFLAASYFFLSILGGAAFFFLQKLLDKKYVRILAVTMIAVLILLHGSNFQPKEWLNISDQDKFSQDSWQKQLTISIFDYLPIYAQLPPNHEAPPAPEILEGKVNIFSYEKGSNYQIGEVEVLEEATLRLPLFDFPGMEVTLNGKVINHVNDDCRGEDYCFGLISFTIPEGRHMIKVQLKDTSVRTIGNIITLVSFFIVVFSFAKIKYGKNI